MKASDQAQKQLVGIPVDATVLGTKAESRAQVPFSSGVCSS